MSLLFMILASLSISFMWLKHPLSMGCILICQTLVIAILSGMMLGSFLFSYIITIIMLSGALVLFIYMASVASNEKFQTPVKLISVFLISMITISMMEENLNYLQGSMSDATILPETMSLMKLFNNLSAYITIMMIMYLLLTMIVITNISSVTEGPLRTKIYEQTYTQNTSPY
uniref:NADH dehydrogenase subunit 6 n=1 Tax=Macroscytus gibbulus TaxID=1316955 RepID=B7SMF0_9HEMI|nr:NADH dehydrogenase subunit 6 [Macroscytus gibbulus]ABZ02044.1 NADH dehydrogenase subunit 6 [Macroscytus gibbulus]